MFLFIFGAGNLQAQNNVNMLPDSGNVGIGTSTPVEKFEVNGNAKIHGKVKMTDSVSVDGSINVLQSLSVADSMTVGANLTVEDNIVVKDSLSVGEAVTIDKNLNVADTLTVGTYLKVSQISDLQSISTNIIQTNTIAGDNTGVVVFGDDGGTGTTTGCENLKLNYCTRTISGFAKQQDGSELLKGVAIGFTSAANGEHSFAAGKACFALGDKSIAMGEQVRAVGENSMFIGSGGAGPVSNTKQNSLMIAFNSNSGLKPSVFVAPGTAALFGNVGIGTDDPKDKFQIGEGEESITFGSALNQEAFYLVGYMGMNVTRTRTQMYQSSVWTVNSGSANGSGGSVIASGSGGKVYIIPMHSCTNAPLVLSDAELFDWKVVEIEPRNRLDCNTKGDGLMKVYGKIWCKEIEINLDPSSWWDEVFEPGYKLRTFEELQAYIDENGHLPDVPSEEEVGENGLDLGESYGILLRKIEELTLYVLELKQENEELRQMIENSGQ